MIVAVHQPNFLPWLGYFYKWAACDWLVFLDDAQYSKNSFINRNRIKTPAGEQWISAPVRHKGRLGQTINETRLTEDHQWVKKILGSIQGNYARAPFFESYYPTLERVLADPPSGLAELNLALLDWAAGHLGLSTPTVRASELTGVQGTATERLVSICRALAADVYLSGAGGQKYQEEEAFAGAEVELRLSDFQHPVYPQLWEDFVPNLSVIDLLFNCGPNSLGIILGRPG